MKSSGRFGVRKKKTIIEINPKIFRIKDREYFYSVLCHEIGHCICYKHGLYATYHGTAQINIRYTKSQLLTVRRTALRAELYA